MPTKLLKGLDGQGFRKRSSGKMAPNITLEAACQGNCSLCYSLYAKRLENATSTADSEIIPSKPCIRDMIPPKTAVPRALPHLLLSTPAKVVALQATAFFPTGFSFKVSFHSIHLTG